MSNSVYTDTDGSWNDGLLEEYKALRAEILSQFQNRNNVLTLGSATLGILFNVAASVGKDVASNIANTDGKEAVALALAPFLSLQISASFVILALTVPLMTSLIIFLWGVYSSRVAMIGSYLLEKEKKLNKRFGEGTFQWEHKLQRERDTDELRQAMAVTFIFTAISLISVILASKMGGLQASTEISHFAPCQILSWIFLTVGFLIGDYRMYKIQQASPSLCSLQSTPYPASGVRSKFPFFMLRRIFFQRD